jgi:acid ceramidase
MNENEHIVNLDLPPSKRWEFLADYKNEIDELLHYYLTDFEGADLIFTGIGQYKKNIISQEYLEEIDYIASISRFSPDQVLIANLYYDILKFYLGCTAFATENNGTILHSRNLDWHTENNLLSKHSKIFDFQRQGKTVFKTVGWLGFIGALSGIKPGKFSLTLNAVLSNDSPEIALPVSFLLRDILDSSGSFEQAKTALENTVIASDCLILLSGTEASEMAVIERTPKRFSTRTSNNGSIIVTNDYKQLENNTSGESILQSTSCGRYDRAEQLINTHFPKDSKDCLEILKDDDVMMNITVQQMVFNTKTGDITLIKTGDV